MFAVIEIGGQQWKVRAGDKLVVNRLPYREGEEFVVDKALVMAGEKEGVLVGTPYLPAQVRLKVEQHLRAPKIVVFKKKRRKGYKRKYGHRQPMTLLTVQSL
ncbi:MAG: 50S ribosomal protein L21 [Bacteroidia bacterium]|nr:50S ribosomal protein L21 [Bacteroidia bacterium]MDW8235946.1 50S ribosomal protein L21 [Bacteroidia bacterium]